MEPVGTSQVNLVVARKSEEQVEVSGFGYYHQLFPAVSGAGENIPLPITVLVSFKGLSCAALGIGFQSDSLGVAGSGRDFMKVVQDAHVGEFVHAPLGKTEVFNGGMAVFH